MNYLQFTDLRNHSKQYFDNIEKGNSYIIIRKGKPIAQIIPFERQETNFKRKIKKIELKHNISTLDYILKERNDK